MTSFVGYKIFAVSCEVATLYILFPLRHDVQQLSFMETFKPLFRVSARRSRVFSMQIWEIVLYVGPEVKNKVAQRKYDTERISIIGQHLRKL